MRRAALVLAALALAGAPAARGAGVPAQASEARSEALARAAAEQTLAAFVPPAGAVASPQEPAGDGGALSTSAAPRSGYVDRLVLTRWWVTATSATQVIAAVRAHPPSGSRLEMEMGFVGSPPLPTGVGFGWPGLPRERGPLRLEVQAAALADGRTGVRAMVEARWLRPRPASEAIPAGMRRLRISVFPFPSGPALVTRQLPLLVTSRGAIERVATLLNALPIAQPLGGFVSCPAPAGVTLRLAFYGARRSRPAAVARDNLVACGGIELELAGRVEPELFEEGDLPAAISRAIGRPLDVRFTTAAGRTFRSRALRR